MKKNKEIIIPASRPFFSKNDINFILGEKQTLGIVGESGCGKSVTSRSILRLIESPGKIEDGSIHYKDSNLLTLFLKY